MARKVVKKTHNAGEHFEDIDEVVGQSVKLNEVLLDRLFPELDPDDYRDLFAGDIDEESEFEEGILDIPISVSSRINSSCVIDWDVTTYEPGALSTSPEEIAALANLVSNIGQAALRSNRE